MTAITDARSDDREMLQRAVAGRYELARELGRGGMGVVYLARDVALEREVAIKVLPPQFAAQPELRDRFLRETRTAAGLSHPNIVPIHAVEEREGLVYFVMDFVDGESLTERVQRSGPLPPSEVARVLAEAGWALAYAHQRGIVHRDVKSDNILIERATGRALLTDFGIARLAGSTLTAVGESLGTPQFMSPEQASGDVVDGRSDLYSLGIVGFFALTARLPFDAPTLQAILAMQVTRPAPPIANLRSGVPPRLVAAIERCLEKTPDARWPSAQAFVEAVQATQQGRVAEVAAPVRSYLRATELTATMLGAIVTALILMVAAQPKHPELLVLWAATFVVVTVVQLTARARLLLGQGFTPEDVRAAVGLERRQHREDAAALGVGDPATRASWLRVLAISALGALIVGAGLARRETAAAGTPARALARELVAFGVVIFILPFFFRSKRWLLRTERSARLTSLLVTGPFGRLIFRLAAPRGDARAVAGTTASTASVRTMLDTLPAPTRRALRDLPPLLRALDDRAAVLAARERDLERAIADAEAGAEGDGAAAHRDAVIAELRGARGQAAEQHAAVLAALERLRLQLLRLRAGVGAPADLAPEIAAARALLPSA